MVTNVYGCVNSTNTKLKNKRKVFVMKKEKSISRKINEILIILGTIIVTMCALNVSALCKIVEFNNTICLDLTNLVAAYESNNAESILLTQDQIAYTMTHCNTRINGTLIFNIVIVIIAIITITLMCIALNKIIAKPIQLVNNGIEQIADGDLTVKFNETNTYKDRLNEKSKDEIICMQESMNNMTNQLSSIIGNIINISNDVSKAMDNLSEGSDAISQSTLDISSAVSEVATGAVSTAEDTQNAMSIASNIEDNVNGIKESTASLSNAAQNMNDAKNNVISILSEFVEANENMSRNVKDTNDQISITSENVKGIQKFIEVIKNIAGQTKLLSLNAQIEAAKNADGRGFAVVATEIGKLAEQSAKASEEIEQTLNKLFENYELIVQKMDMTNEDIASQNVKLNKTREHFEVLNSDINVTTDKIQDINVMIEELDTLRHSLIDIISGLSAVSEENAAASEQTTASIEELTSTITQMCEDINDVKDKANILFEKVNVFKI